MQIMLEGVGTRGSDTEQVPSDGGNKRRKLDRAGGAVLPWHAVHLQPEERTRRRQPRNDDHGAQLLEGGEEMCGLLEQEATLTMALRTIAVGRTRYGRTTMAVRR